MLCKATQLGAVSLCLLALPAAASADDDREPVRSQFWIGVTLEHLPEIVKSQLQLRRGMVVSRVLADSPAAKAELKKHDIILQVGETPAADHAVMATKINETGNKALEFTIMRSGEKKVVTITPGEKPRDPGAFMQMEVDPKLPHQAWQLDNARSAIEEALRKHGMGRAAILDLMKANERPRWLQLGPGVLLEGDQDTELSIEIKKQGDAPARIHIERNGDKWEVTEDDLSSLPEDLRDKVKPHLERNNGAAGQSGATEQSRVIIRRGANLGGDQRAKQLVEEVRKHMTTRRQEALQQAKQNAERFGFGANTGVVDELRKEIKRLREEIDKLKDAHEDAASSESDRSS